MSKYYYGPWEFTIYTATISYKNGDYKSTIKLDSREHSQISGGAEKYLRDNHIIDPSDQVSIRQRNYRKK